MNRGFFGIGIYHPKTVHNVGTLWRSAHNMGASFIFTIGKRYQRQACDTTKAHLSVPLFEYSSLDELCRSQPRESLLIGIEQTDASETLNRIAHPERAVYLLGAEDYGLPAELLAQCHRVLEIPSTRCLNVGVVGSIVMYDRMLKGTSRYRSYRTNIEHNGMHRTNNIETEKP